MASNSFLNPIFDWGDTVTIKTTAPKYFKPGCQGCICGVRVINSEEIALQFDQLIGSELYLVEFEDGKSLEIPKSFLNILDKNI